MCVYVHAHVGVLVCVSMHMEVKHWCQLPSFITFHVSYWSRVPRLNCSPPIQLVQICSFLLGSIVFASVPWNKEDATTTQALPECRGSELRSSCQHSKYFTHRAHCIIYKTLLQILSHSSVLPGDPTNTQIAEITCQNNLFSSTSLWRWVRRKVIPNDER